MLRAKNKSNSKSLKLSKLNFAIPLMAFAGLGALSIAVINQDIDPSASASNTVPISSTLSYNDEYITISTSTGIDLSSDTLTADASYAYATDNVTVSTNVNTGYELYLSSSNTTSADLTTTGSNDKVKATSGTGGELGTPAVLDDNSYGYAVASSQIGNTNFDTSYASPNSNSKFAAVPAGRSDRLRTTSTAVTEGETTSVYYGANVNNALTPGTYTGAVVYSAVVTPTNGMVEMSVSPSTGGAFTTLTITSGPTTINPAVNLANDEVEVYLRQGGVTKGTCNVINIDAGSGHLVTTCVVQEGMIGGIYDVVISIPRYGFKDMKSSGFTISTMQTFTKSKCQALTTFDPTNAKTIANTTYALQDSRDNNSYFVRRLADGNCWMVQNLRLTGDSLSTAGHSATLKSSDNDTSLASGSFKVPNSSAWISDNATTGALIAAIDAPIGSVNGDAANNNLAYARGTYYTWATAVLNTNPIDNSSTRTDSICPKGWNLPAYGGTSSFQTLYTSYSSNYNATMTAYDYYYSQDSTKTDYFLVGNWNADYGYIFYSGQSSQWWSNTSGPSYATTAYYMSASAGAINTQNNYLRRFGYSVRCVFVGS